MKQTLRHAAGSLLVVGLSGTALTELERAWMRMVQPGGVVLFRRNIAGAAQTRALLDEAMRLCATRCMRCVDVEGGLVDRLREVLAATPSAQAVARAARQTGRAGLAREHGELIARGVKAFGFNTTFAPVLDLGLPASAAVMGTRTAGASAAEVTDFARAFLAGLAAQGVAGCGKHFPGLGGGALDSHVATPQIDRSWRELRDEDLAPYRALRDALPMVMTSHAAYPKTRSGVRPASVSSFWMRTVLRQRIGYRGLIVSDDLEMGGIAKYMPIEAAAVTAARAGADLFLICHNAEVILRTHEALISEGERSAAFARLLLERARQTASKRAALFQPAMGPEPGARRLDQLRGRMERFREEIDAIAEESKIRRTLTPAETT
ncbi:MAG TPA: beta-N-acetylhexosaminidase [Terracidiphilus sp.]|nr:beta-N-acetylhexosaminidase [Terracidiphilus sp.]